LLSLARRWAKPQQQQQHRSVEPRQQQQHPRFAGCLAEPARTTLQPHENPAMGCRTSAAANSQEIDLARTVGEYISGTVTITAISTLSSSLQL
jgi:hypothetical protein